MTPPSFWSNTPKRPGWQSKLLSPLAQVYANATARRVAQSGYKASVPVICIGNINAGGTGKTPTVIALVQKLQAMGKTVHVVSRGYGGKFAGPVRVVEREHSADDVGDEPLLIAAFAPVWVSKDRALGVKAAEAGGADVILLDDGMQNPSVIKDATFVVVDAHRGFGNGRVMPAGPLREPVDVGLKRGDIVISIGDAAAQSRFDTTWGGHISLPQVRAQLAPLETGMDWNGLRALAFAGIGHPEKFFATLEGLGATLIRKEALRDHQPLPLTLMKRLEIEAATLDAQLVTTEKDAVRLPHAFQMKVLTLPVRMTIQDETPIDAVLTQIGIT
ncbi:tetraacyldisaccharide 4'-kinase [Pacificibacter marinus]|uniref:tetraacyldisaccharide 4'-kinase n=1 Tax=Pacificibacter marinus TaxID=658057 RepID=UPI001C06D6C4|nr:tetraacyldisaccharide 4'-kinase [Pacificibacter marinus]MBU2866608.1 tetraacyldisaccharide 4'-kinase [Pacificibacter marinus]